jgi:hypothetical protein
MQSIRNRFAGIRLSGSKGRTGRAALIMVGAGSLVCGLAGTASAATASARPADASTSTTVAGYYAVPSIGLTSASATFVVPKVKCKAGQTGVGQFVGLFDANPTSDSPSALSVAAANIFCSDGVATYEADAFLDGQSQILSGPEPGNTLVVSIAQTASTELATVSDLTTDTTATISHAPIPDSAISIGFDSTVPTEKFSPVTFTKVQVNGQYLNMQPNTQYSLLSGAKTLDKTSAIASPGDSFSVTYEHAS